MLRPGCTVLPAMVWTKVEDFDEGRAGRTAEPKPEGFGPNQTGPSGFQAAGAHGVGTLGRAPSTTFASLLVDRLAARETELMQPDRSML